MAGMASPHDLRFPSDALLAGSPVGAKKNCVPVLTLSQARRLVAATLPRPDLDADTALKIVEYHLRRNYIAYRSHSKKKSGVVGNSVLPRCG